MESRKPTKHRGDVRLTLAPVIPLSVKAALPVKIVLRRPSGRPADTFFARVLAASLLIALPLMASFGVLMYNQGLQSSAQDANLQAKASATTTADRIQQWITASQAYLAQLARDVHLTRTVAEQLEHGR